MKNKLKHLVPVLLALATITVSLSACELKPKAQQKVSKQGFYFDTIIQITLYGTTNEKYIDDCFDMAKKYEDMLSNTVSYSEVSKINDAAGKEAMIHLSSSKRASNTATQVTAGLISL